MEMLALELLPTDGHRGRRCMWCDSPFKSAPGISRALSLSARKGSCQGYSAPARDGYENIHPFSQGGPCGPGESTCRVPPCPPAVPAIWRELGVGSDQRSCPQGMRTCPEPMPPLWLGHCTHVCAQVGTTRTPDLGGDVGAQGARRANFRAFPSHAFLTSTPKQTIAS